MKALKFTHSKELNSGTTTSRIFLFKYEIHNDNSPIRFNAIKVTVTDLVLGLLPDNIRNTENLRKVLMHFAKDEVISDYLKNTLNDNGVFEINSANCSDLENFRYLNPDKLAHLLGLDIIIEVKNICNPNPTLASTPLSVE